MKKIFFIHTFFFIMLFLINCTQSIKKTSYYIPSQYRTKPITQQSNKNYIQQKLKIIKDISPKEQAYLNKINFGHREQLDGIASWYGPNFHGKKTANGEIYNENAMTAAHRFLPINTWIQVTNQNNKKKIILRINDRGPYAKGRILDCSKKCANILNFYKKGTAPIKIKILKLPKNFDYKYGLTAYKTFVVQFGVYNNKKRLNSFKKLMEKRYRKSSFKIDYYNGKYHLVAGPFAKKNQAKTLAYNYKKEGFNTLVRSLRK